MYISPQKVIAEYTALNSAVTNSILAHQYGEVGFTTMPGKLPTKKGNFAFTMGPGTKQLSEISGGNYGLFLMTTDQFSSGSRKAMQVLGFLGCGIGVCMMVSGGIHVAYVSLVELDTGNVVWFNLQRGSKGDVREEAGARDMIRAVMTGMPSRPGEMTSAATQNPK